MQQYTSKVRILFTHFSEVRYPFPQIEQTVFTHTDFLQFFFLAFQKKKKVINLPSEWQ